MGCCSKIPFRVWIALMVFLTTYINYTTRVNMSVAIISMVTAQGKQTEAYCKRIANEGKTPPKTTPSNSNETVIEQATTVKPLPDYGPRYDWTEQLQGQILGSYFWGYVVSSLFGGTASELIGPFHVIFWSHIVIAVFNSACVWMAGVHYAALMACRLVIGLMAGFVYPALQVLIAKWAPPAEKGKFVSMLMGNTLGTCATWPLVGAITMSLNWAWGFHVISVQNVVFCAIFFFVAADTPEKSKCVSEDELNFIKEAQGGSVSKKKMVAPYLKIFLSFPFWVLATLHFGNLWGLYLQLTMVPKFMSQTVGFDLKSSGGISALPHIMRLFTGIGFGMLEDFLKSRQLTSTKFNRKFFTLFSHIIPGICLMLMALTKCNAVGNIVLLVMSMASNGAATITNLRNAQDLAPNFAGTIFGIISFIGGLTGFIVPAIAGATLSEKSTAEWSINFILGGCVYCFGGIIFILFGSVELQPWNEPNKDVPE